jgi:predicted DNA-binding protein (MmcQ/YjbR family)
MNARSCGDGDAITAPMTLDTVRAICGALPQVTEDIKWGHDLCFCVGKKMFVVVNLEPPHQVAFKCTPESFAELVERPGIIPAPYMARNMWVMEEELGEALDRRELTELVKTSYDLIVAKLPKSKRPGVRSASKRGRGRRTPGGNAGKKSKKKS